MKKILLVANGFLGDNLFISSTAEKLLAENICEQVDMVTGFPQVGELLINNPHVTQVFGTPEPTQNVSSAIQVFDLSEYDKVIHYPPFSFDIPPAAQAQLIAGVTNVSPSFTVYTSETTDAKMNAFVTEIRDKTDKKIIAWMSNWKQKAFRFTEQEYFFGQNDPQGLTGYGRENRNIEKIIEELSNEYYMIPVGVPQQFSQFDTVNGIEGFRTFSEEASLLKYCDYFIGTEGGLANLAAGVGCKTILTHEFVWQCYGPRGTVRPLKDGPQLGPVYYFPKGHMYLPLYKTDEEIITLIKDAI